MDTPGDAAPRERPPTESRPASPVRLAGGTHVGRLRSQGRRSGSASRLSCRRRGRQTDTLVNRGLLERGPRPIAPGLDRPFVTAFPAARGFATLRHDPPRVLVVGAVMRPWTRAGGHVTGLAAATFDGFDEPGHVRVAMSFELEPSGDRGTEVATETRIAPTSADAARRFAIYWLAIRPGSALIRRDNPARGRSPDPRRAVTLRLR